MIFLFLLIHESLKIIDQLFDASIHVFITMYDQYLKLIIEGF